MHGMYSLYRAWLMRDALSLSGGGTCNTLPPPPTAPIGPPMPPIPQTTMTGAPNVVIQVGPTLTHFSAHRNVLAAHSGYFKAALSNETGTNPISIPNINVDEFSSLLTFMYTGYLDLNLNNIYNILLATHVLHMPRALEMCREFLIRNHPIEQTSSHSHNHNIIKPIPSRKFLPSQQQFFQPVITSLQSSESTPFRPIAISTTTAAAAAAALDKQPLLVLPTDTTTQTLTNRNPPAIASTSRQTPSPILNPCDDSDEQKSIKYEQRKSRKRSTDSIKMTADDKDKDKVVVDIACCDGPVRFHRVVNNSYGITSTDTEYKMIDSNEAMNKAMNANIRDKKLNQPDENSPTESFTCVYCNHTFKSQYCYQKHARRHINPVTLEVKNCQNDIGTSGSGSGTSSSNNNTTTTNKREVKLLDMNVQYYPCKTCGSKFPSYYFVHKHRKMCHAEEMDKSNEKSSSDEKSNQ